MASYREFNIGRINGLSSYELAVQTGAFEGTEEEYIAKEQKTYDDMVAYGEALKAQLEDLLNLPEDLTKKLDNHGEVDVNSTSYTTIGDVLDNVYKIYYPNKTTNQSYTFHYKDAMYMGLEDGTNGIQMRLSWLNGLAVRRKIDGVWMDWANVALVLDKGE